MSMNKIQLHLLPRYMIIKCNTKLKELKNQNLNLSKNQAQIIHHNEIGQQSNTDHEN